MTSAPLINLYLHVLKENTSCFKESNKAHESVHVIKFCRPIHQEEVQVKNGKIQIRFICELICYTDVHDTHGFDHMLC